MTGLSFRYQPDRWKAALEKNGEASSAVPVSEAVQEPRGRIYEWIAEVFNKNGHVTPKLFQGLDDEQEDA